MSDDQDDIILSELNDDDLVAQMFDDLYDGLKEEIEDGVNILLEREWTPYDIRFWPKQARPVLVRWSSAR